MDTRFFAPTSTVRSLCQQTVNSLRLNHSLHFEIRYEAQSQDVQIYFF
jgi:hypothetical protein